jgi:hypothetical protein
LEGDCPGFADEGVAEAPAGLGEAVG